MTYVKWALRAAMAGAATLAVTAALAPPSTGAAKAAATAATAWTIYGKNAFAGDDEVEDVTVSPGGSTWGAGYRHVDSNGGRLPLVQHWVDGRFRTVTLPSTWRGHFATIDASSSKNVWALGQNGPNPIAARWNGTAWRGFSLPMSAMPGDAEALSATDVWAVSDGPGVNSAHWNGTAWSGRTLPIRPRGIDGKASSLWTAGWRYNADGNVRPAAARWTGSAWTQISPPEFTLPRAGAEARFDDLVVVSATNVWAVGVVSWEDSDESTHSKPLLAHYAGGKWNTWTSAEAPGYTKVVSDGLGGINILQGSWNPTVLHGRDGVWTRTPLPRTSGYDAAGFSLERNPVTGTLWSSGFQVPEGDPDDPTANGTYWRRLAD